MRHVHRPRADCRSGHIPGSRSLPFGHLLGEDGKMKPPERLQAAFDLAGVGTGAQLVASCGSGVTAAIISLALAQVRGDIWEI